MSEDLDLAEKPGETDSASEQAASDPIEALASEIGWKPKTEDWEGEHLDAKSFIKAQSDKAKASKERANRAEEAAKRAVRTSEKALREARKRIEEGAEERIRKATEANDPDAALEAARDLAEAQKVSNPDVDGFVAKNAWFNTHQRATTLAIGVTNDAAARGLSIPEQLQEAEEAVREAYPQLFEEQAERKPQKAPPVVADGNRTAQAKPREKGISDVPAPVRAAWTPSYCKLFETTPAELAKLWHEDHA